MNNADTLIHRLESIVASVHIKEVKDIISKLAKINTFKLRIENDLCTASIYENIAKELKEEFCTNNIKIVQLHNNIETTLYQLGNTDSFTYTHISKVSPNTSIIIFIENDQLTSFQELTLNSYFNEIVHILYIQFVLSSLQKTILSDPLTGLKNRLSFNEEMKALIPLATREGMNIGVLLINIDRFRAVNDEHGNVFGDKFLKLYADIIRQSIRSSDIAVRFGGGEFLILLVNVDSENRTLQLAEKLKDLLANTSLKTSAGDDFKKTVCIGVSMFPEDSSDMNEVVKNAEIALSDAKDKGRNTLLRFQPIQESPIELF
jgi:diguanylate cyclase (GGDEF)-like protein